MSGETNIAHQRADLAEENITMNSRTSCHSLARRSCGKACRDTAEQSLPSRVRGIVRNRHSRRARGLRRRYRRRGARPALAVDGVLVWVDPIHQGQTRSVLDAMLRDVASRGPWVSAHPDVILKMGVKEVLHRTKHLGWGTDTHLYRTAAAFRDAFPLAPAIGRPARPQAEPRQRRSRRLEGRSPI